MLSRRTVLGTLGAVATLGGGSAESIAASGAAANALPLRACAGRDLVYGAAAATYQVEDPAFSRLLAREAGMLVPEYELKRAIIEPLPGTFDFSGSDRLLAFAGRHGMAFRGHPLIWHKRNPAWLDAAFDDQRADLLIEDYIARVAGHYRGRIHSWDVVNEAIDPTDGRADNLRNTAWLGAFGPSYIGEAFHAARAADPAAILVYNDWGCEAGLPANDRFRAATLNFLEHVLAQGVPIDALGLQGHLAAFGPRVDQKKLAAFLAHVKSMGLKILVTEHDVDDGNGPPDVVSRDRAVADASRRFLDVVLDCDATIAVLTWGLSDRFLQPDNWRAALLRGVPRMLPYDGDLEATPMRQAIADAFARRRAG